jgi:hypothetical protein
MLWGTREKRCDGEVKGLTPRAREVLEELKKVVVPKGLKPFLCTAPERHGRKKSGLQRLKPFSHFKPDVVAKATTYKTLFVRVHPSPTKIRRFSAAFRKTEERSLDSLRFYRDTYRVANAARFGMTHRLGGLGDEVDLER